MKKLDANVTTGRAQRLPREEPAPLATTTTTTTTTAPPTTPATPATTLPSKAALAAQRVALGQVGPQATKPKTTATQAMEVTAKLQDRRAPGSFVRSAVVAAMTTLTLLGSALWNNAKADTMFLDHNNAPMEIQVAKRLAASIGEKFVLVRPDDTALDSVFQKAERGEIDLRHLILSGHSSGSRVWGQGVGGERHETSMDQLKELKAKYPKAFKSVQHVHFMSCYSGSAGNSAQWAAVFPNTKIAGFWGSGPSKTQPAAGLMLQNSEMSLRKLDGRNLSPQQAMIAAKQMAQQPGSSVTKFAVRLPTSDGASVHFALGEKVTSKDVAEDRVNVLRARAFDGYMNPVGQDSTFASPPRTHSSGPLRDYYNALHTYLNALPAGDHSATTVRDNIDVTIRLIYFDVIQQKMQGAHGAVFQATDSLLQAAGSKLQIGDVSKLSRLQVVQLAQQLKDVGQLQWAGFDGTHKADLDVVNAWLSSNGKAAVSSPTTASTTWEASSAASTLGDNVVGAPAVVKDAAGRLQAALNSELPAPFAQALKLLDVGLKQLSPDVIPSTWIE